MPELVIADLSRLKPGRIFYSGRLYIVEATGSASKARLWGAPPGTTKDCVTLSHKSVLVRFYPVLERAMVLPILKRSDFLLDRRPTAYSFENMTEAHRAAQLDNDLVAGSGLSLQRLQRMSAWELTDGANPYRLYHYSTSSDADERFAAYCAKNNCTACTWPDERTEHWKFLFDMIDSTE